MPKKIKITQRQLDEAVNLMKVNEEAPAVNVHVNKEGNENTTQALQTTIRDTERALGSNKPVNYVIPSSEIHEAKTFTKTQIMEARRKYLKENSKVISKNQFLRKK